MKLLEALLVDSYSGDYRKVIGVITDFLKHNTNAKIIVQEIDDKKANVIAVFGNPKLLINCHMDTVPPVGDWDHEPTEMVETNDEIFGLGTTDTKGNIFSVLKAAASVKPKDIMLLFTVDEESGKDNIGVNTFLNSEYRKGIGYAIVCEPTSLRFVNKHKGYYSFIIEVISKPEHSSKKTCDNELSANAITKAAGLIQTLDKSGYNIGKISGGTIGNIVAVNCVFKVSMRSYKEPGDVLDEVKTLVKDVPGTEVTPFYVGSQLIQADAFPFIQDEMHEVDFWTEAALFKNAGIDAVVFGAGNIAQAHKNNEFVLKKELEEAEKILGKIMEAVK